MNPDYDQTAEIDHILRACARRFDGYKYAKSHQFDYMAALRMIEQTSDLAPFEQRQQLALFYILQRFLYKFGDLQPLSSPHWSALRELFLLCCRVKIPKPYRLEPYYSKWEDTYAPRLDEYILLVRRTHESIDYLAESALDPSIQPQTAKDNDQAYRDKLGLARDDLRRFEEQALNLLRIFPEATVARTSDAIQLNVHGERGIVLLITPEALEVRLPTVEWTQGAYGPAASSTLWQRVLWQNISTADVYTLCTEAQKVRAEQFVPCRFCGEQFPPEHRHDDVCHGCAERELGIVH